MAMAMLTRYSARVVRVRVGSDLQTAIKKGITALDHEAASLVPGKTFTIKPNLNSADPYPASSDPAFVRALGEVLLDMGAANLRLVECSMLGVRTRDVATKTGMMSVAEELGTEIEFLDEGEWIEQTVPGGRYLRRVRVGDALLRAENIVLAPCLKTHKYARFTGAMKLFVASMRKRDRILLHARHLEEKIPELASLFHPVLIVMDARKVFVTGGPFSGRVESPGLVIVGTDMVAVDVVGVRVLQRYEAKNRLDVDAWELPQIRRAVELGMGVVSDDQIELLDIEA